MEFYFPAISTGVLVVTAALMALVGHRLSFRVRILWPTVVLACFSTAVPIISLLLAAELISPGRALELTLLAVCPSPPRPLLKQHLPQPLPLPLTLTLTQTPTPTSTLRRCR